MSSIFLFPVKLGAYRIIDGDTLSLSLDRGFKETKVVSLRLSGLNAPETRTRRLLEKQAGLLVKKIVAGWVEERKHLPSYATSESKPKYAGRIIGQFFSTPESISPEEAEITGLPTSLLISPWPAMESLNTFLLQLQIVKPYTGGKREFSDEELQAIITKCNGFLERQ